MKLDCKISQDGFRTRQLRDFLAKNWALKINKILDFEVVSNDIPKNLLHKVQWFWKVRNVGNEAIKRNQERGQIFLAGTTRREVTSFNGDHYVECYAVINNIVIARDRIKVPISTFNGKDQHIEISKRHDFCTDTIKLITFDVAKFFYQWIYFRINRYKN